MTDVMAERRAQALNESWALRLELWNRTYPAEPLARYCTDRRLSLRNLAAIGGVSTMTTRRWVTRGLKEHEADRVAISLGLHPSELWPQWWDHTHMAEHQINRRVTLAGQIADGGI
jgi:lambda repressor-like predicted transcriptional regulator